MAETVYGKMVDKLINTVNKQVSLETDDGVQRQGKLTGWRMRSMKLDGEEVTMPIALELNSDPMDTVQLDRVKRMVVKD